MYNHSIVINARFILFVLFYDACSKILLSLSLYPYDTSLKRPENDVPSDDSSKSYFLKGKIVLFRFYPVKVESNILPAGPISI